MISPHQHGPLFRAFAIIALCLGPISGSSSDASSGEQIYKDLCAKCHGSQGQGVPGKHEEPLQGSRSLASLSRLIHRTMPEDEPERCQDEQAAQVASFIYHAFYSPEARRKQGRLRIELAHLTVRQHLNSVADLCQGETRLAGEARGLQATYYKSRNARETEKVFERVDPQIDFDYGLASPDTNQIPAEEFSIQWQGSLLAEETGDYEFVLRSANGVRLWVNNPHEALIDAWVSSGNEPREHRQTLRLLGGRRYPLALHHFKFKEKQASVTLLWKPPHGVLAPVPARNLSPLAARATLVLQTPFPPDDGSVGYPRGVGVSRSWDEATTHAAIEVAEHIVDNLDRLARTESEAEDRAAKIEGFCKDWVERAFRRPLSPAEVQRYVHDQIEASDKLEEGVRRIVLLAMKSPRFLYLGLPDEATSDFVVAERLSYAMWDSVPDSNLWDAAAAGALRTRDQIVAQAGRMLEDARTRSKIRHFFHQWLQMDQVDNLAKDATRFPDFTPGLIADLRLSLDLFLEDVFWSEGSDYRRLLLASNLFLNKPLAEFYGAQMRGADFEEVEFGPAQRSGILTHPYLLATFSYAQASSPIHRGVFLTRNIIGHPLKPPPNAVSFDESEFDPNLTMREKVAQLTRAEACQNCHSVINPLGFSLEHFDAVGRFRTEENNRPIDATGEFITDTGETVRLGGARDVASFAVASAQAQGAFIEQLFHEVLKQPALAHGDNTLQELREQFVQSSFNMRRLLVNIATVGAMHGLKANPDSNL